MSIHPLLRRKPRRRSCLGCLGRLCLWLFPFLILAIGTVVALFFVFPPFGKETTARIAVAGLDNMEKGAQRSDTIMMVAAKLNGSGVTVISVPRDARVILPGHQRYGKINAAYAEGKETFLREALASPDIMDADLPYYLTFDSEGVAAIVNAPAVWISRCRP